MNEAFLQFVWQHKLLERPLVSTNGLSLVVLRPGTLNRDAGPDFFDARILVDGVQLVGNVEVHVRASDWKRHHHASDAAYNNVILHAVYDDDAPISLQNGTKPLTLELNRFIPDAVWSNYHALLNPPPELPVPCQQRLAQIPPFLLNSFLQRLVVQRLEAKTALVARFLSDSHGSWEHACYWLLAHYFGGKVNAFPFELLAKATDFRLIHRWKDQPLRIEALLMGQAGFLCNFLNDDFPRTLQADYDAIRRATGLNPISPSLWKFFGMRPSSFPTVRISQFAHLLSRSPNLFSLLLDCSDVSQIVALFDVHASDYWSSHFRFDQPSSSHCVKHLGTTLIHSLIINAWVPLLFEYGRQHADEHRKAQAFSLLEQLPPESNAILRRWASVGLSADNAALSQALILLHNDYCSQHRCLDCRIGFYVMRDAPLPAPPPLPPDE